MKSEIIRNRIPFVGLGLVILTIGILTFIIIPGFFIDKTPGLQVGPSVKAIIIAIILHLLICYAFREMIITNKRGVRLKNIVFIITGTGLLVLGLFLSDGAFAMLGHANMKFVAFSWLVGIACDVVAGILVFVALFFQPKKAIAK